MKLIVRNYLSSVLVVTVCGLMLGNLSSQSASSAGQERVETFGKYIGAGLVAQAQNLGQ